MRRSVVTEVTGLQSSLLQDYATLAAPTDGSPSLRHAARMLVVTMQQQAAALAHALGSDAIDDAKIDAARTSTGSRRRSSSNCCRPSRARPRTRLCAPPRRGGCRGGHRRSRRDARGARGHDRRRRGHARRRQRPAAGPWPGRRRPAAASRLASQGNRRRHRAAPERGRHRRRSARVLLRCRQGRGQASAGRGAATRWRSRCAAPRSPSFTSSRRRAMQAPAAPRWACDARRAWPTSCAPAACPSPAWPRPSATGAAAVQHAHRSGPARLSGATRPAAPGQHHRQPAAACRTRARSGRRSPAGRGTAPRR